MPTYDLTRHVVDENGKPLPFDDKKPNEGATLKQILCRALVSDYSPTMGVPPSVEEKNKRFDLYMKLKLAGDSIELTIEEATTLKGVTGSYTTLICGQLNYILDGKPGLAEKNPLKSIAGGKTSD